jgi:hypothetical protein
MDWDWTFGVPMKPYRIWKAEEQKRRRSEQFAFARGFGFAALCGTAWWLLALAFCQGCITLHHEFDPVTVTIRTEFGVLNEKPDGGR